MRRRADRRTQPSQPSWATATRGYGRRVGPRGKRRLVIAGGALLAAGGALAWWVARQPVEPVVDIVEHAPVRELEPAGRHSGGARVLLVALDGVADEELFRAVDDRTMPRTAAVFGARRDEDGRVREHGWIVPGALSILPSTTFAAWASVLTGEPVARTGISGNEWFERERRRFRAPAPVSVREHEHTVLAVSEDLVGRAIRGPTLFERLDGPSHVSLLPIQRGASVYTVPDPTALAGAFAALARGLGPDTSIAGEAYRQVDEGSVEGIAEAVREHGLPTLQVAYFPGVDLSTHVAPEPLDHLRRYLTEVIDPALARILALYEERGALEDTWVVVVSDHGHTPVLEDDRHALGAGEPDEPTAVLDRMGIRVRPPELEPDAEDYQAVFAYQGAIAYVYLADRSTCPDAGQRCDWTRPPRLEEDVLTVARAFYESGRGRVGGLGGALDLVLAREPRSVEEDARPFEVWDGSRLVPLRRWLDANPRPDLLDFAARMDALSEGPEGHRAGDVLLLARSGMHRPIEERFYFSRPYRSWHGSPAESDSTIALAVARAGHSGEMIRERVRRVVGASPSQLHVTPLVLDLAGSE